MKSPLLGLLIVVQLATLGLVVGLLLQRNDPARDDALRTVSAKLDVLAAQLGGAINQERQIVNYLEMLRRDAAAGEGGGGTDPAGASDAPVSGGTPTEPKPDGAGDAAPPPTPPDARPNTPFPEAAAALAAMRRMEQELRREIADNGQNVGPLRTELDRQRKLLLGRQHEAVYVVREAVQLQPFETGFDAKFVEWLLDQVVPSLAAFSKDDAFMIARSALVRSTNDGPVKFAAAKALRAISPDGWTKDVIDAIALGSNREVGARAQMLGLFADDPRPEAVDLCRRFLDDAQHPMELRTKAVTVLAKQNSGAVNAMLRRVLFEDPSPLLKNLALDALWSRLTPEERARLAEQVIAEDPARMPPGTADKARELQKQLGG